jgi:hypothetical protein
MSVQKRCIATTRSSDADSESASAIKLLNQRGVSRKSAHTFAHAALAPSSANVRAVFLPKAPQIQKQITSATRTSLTTTRTNFVKCESASVVASRPSATVEIRSQTGSAALAAFFRCRIAPTKGRLDDKMVVVFEAYRRAMNSGLRGTTTTVGRRAAKR